MGTLNTIRTWAAILAFEFFVTAVALRLGAN